MFGARLIARAVRIASSRAMFMKALWVLSFRSCQVFMGFQPCCEEIRVAFKSVAIAVPKRNCCSEKTTPSIFYKEEMLLSEVFGSECFSVKNEGMILREIWKKKIRKGIEGCLVNCYIFGFTSSVSMMEATGTLILFKASSRASLLSASAMKTTLPSGPQQ